MPEHFDTAKTYPKRTWRTRAYHGAPTARAARPSPSPIPAAALSEFRVRITTGRNEHRVKPRVKLITVFPLHCQLALHHG